MRRFSACDRWLLRRSCTRPRVASRGRNGRSGPAQGAERALDPARTQVKGATRRAAPAEGMRGCRRCCVQPPSDAANSRKRGGDRWTSQVAGDDHSPPTTWPIAEPATVPEDAHTAPRSARTVQTAPEMSDSLPHTESDSPPTTWPIAEPAVPEHAHTAPRSARTAQSPEMSDSLPQTESDIAGSKARSRSRALCRDRHAPVTEGRRLSFSLCGRQNDVLAWFVTGR